jgi:L-amino acid N-acyltransferase YncA
MIVRSDGAIKRVPTPVALDEKMAKDLAFELEVISLLKGEADITGVMSEYETWYHAAAKRFESQPNKALAAAYFNRHRNHILKLAVIYEAARNYVLSVTDSSWNHAVATASTLENTIFSLLTTGMNALGFKQKKAEDLIRDAGQRGLHMSLFTRAFQHDSPRDREAWLRTLIDACVVKEVPRPTAGRTASILIHRDFWEKPAVEAQPEEEVCA